MIERTYAQTMEQAKYIRRKRKIEKAAKMGLYYTTQSVMGIPWWTWLWMIGARGRGKSHAAMKTVLDYV